MTVRPHNDYVMIDRPRSKNFTDGGIMLPTLTGRRKPNEGVVIAIGSGKRAKKSGGRICMDVQVGDRVIFRQADVVKDKTITDKNGKPYIFVPESGILAILDKDCDYKPGKNDHLR